MQITNEARDFLKQVLQEKNAKSIRFYFAGFGWGKPQIGLALDEPEAEDKIVTINEIQVAIDPNIEAHTDDLKLILNEETNGLELVGNESDCC